MDSYIQVISLVVSFIYGVLFSLLTKFNYFIIENKDADFSFPVLILVGDKDSTGKVKAYCKEWAKQTGYPLHFIKQAKHFSNGDNPDQVNAEIENFIIETVQQERKNYAVL